jgi:mRNA-degrading endonuclease toxin of MazEF toxin-antitoxin module
MHQAAVPGAQARLFVILTEDLWNEQMRDSVIVPVYDLVAGESAMSVALPDAQTAICTRVQSMPHEFIGPAVKRCPTEPLRRIQQGVSQFLAIEQRRTKTETPPPDSPRDGWWPRQNDIHFASNAAIGPEDKLYAVIADDDWNSLPSSSYTAAVRLTSKTKPQRMRWEIPVAGGWIVTGDLYSIAYSRFEQSHPRDPYPKSLTTVESSRIAGRQRTTLGLRATSLGRAQGPAQD